MIHSCSGTWSVRPALVMLGGADAVLGDHLEGVVLAGQLGDAVAQVARGPEALLDFLVSLANARWSHSLVSMMYQEAKDMITMMAKVALATTPPWASICLNAKTGFLDDLSWFGHGSAILYC